MATIFIRKDEVYRTRIEDVTNKNQFFYPVYQQARDSLLELIKYSQKYWEENGTANHLKEANRNPMRLRGYPNNFIAFCADRGHGKTSAMLSFSKALTNPDKDVTFWKENMDALRFFALESIDPTVLENTDHIIPTIISRMFVEFTRQASALHNHLSADSSTYYNREKPVSHHELRDQQQRLLNLFQECYRLADEQKDNKKRSDNYDDLQLLADRGDSSNFKVRFWELVKEYLYFMEKGSGSPSGSNCLNSFLVIQIDDADMNPEHAYDVVEDLRKYCVLPNVIILFATNIEQLEMCVEQHFLKSFDPLIKASFGNDPDSLKTLSSNLRHCHDTTASYLDKLIPSLHRINLPNVNNTLQNYGTPIYLHHSEFHTKEQIDHPQEYQEALVSILKDRCLLRLQVEAGQLHPFLPRRMRELTHFLNRMSSLKEAGTRRALLQWTVCGPDGDYDDSTPQQLKKNLEYLMDYLVYDWCDLVLDPRQRKVIREIHHATTYHKIDIALEHLQQMNIPEGGQPLRASANSSPAVLPCRNCTVLKQQPGDLAEGESRPRSTLVNPHSNQWSSLMNCIEQLHHQEKAQFACALELYFAIYKELLLVGACIGAKDDSGYKATKITALGDCNTIWYIRGVSNPLCCMGGFEIDLKELGQKLDVFPITDSLRLALDSWFYVKNETENDNGQSISDLYKEKRSIKVVFDPLRFSELDWETLSHLFHSRDYDYCEEMIDEAEVRLALFANRPLQCELIRELEKKAKTYGNGWVHFQKRIRDFWEIANAVCLEKPVVMDPAYDDVLDIIFLTNPDNRRAYVNRIRQAFAAGDSMENILNYISRLLEKLSDAVQVTPTSRKRSSNYNELIVYAFEKIEMLWEKAWKTNEPVLEILNTRLTRDLWNGQKQISIAIPSVVPKAYSAGRNPTTAQAGKERQDFEKMLMVIKPAMNAVIKDWDELMRAELKVKNDPIPEAEEVLKRLTDWIAEMESKPPKKPNETNS